MDEIRDGCPCRLDAIHVGDDDAEVIAIEPAGECDVAAAKVEAIRGEAGDALRCRGQQIITDRWPPYAVYFGEVVEVDQDEGCRDRSCDGTPDDVLQ